MIPCVELQINLNKSLVVVSAIRHIPRQVNKQFCWDLPDEINTESIGLNASVYA